MVWGHWFGKTSEVCVCACAFECVLACACVYLVVLPIDFGDDCDEGESHDGDQSQLPGNPEHEDEEPYALNHTPQEHVDVLRNQVTHLSSVRGQARGDVTCSTNIFFVYFFLTLSELFSLFNDRIGAEI